MYLGFPFINMNHLTIDESIKLATTSDTSCGWAFTSFIVTYALLKKVCRIILIRRFYSFVRYWAYIVGH